MFWKKVVSVTLSLLCVLMFTFPVYAEEDQMTEPNVEKEGGVELSSKRFPVSRYMANNEDADATIKGAFVGLTNAVFSISGYIVLLVDTSMDKLYSLEPIDRFADTLTAVSTNIYNTLKKHFGQMLFIFAVCYIVYLCVVKQSIREAMRRSFLFFMVLVFGAYWMMNAGFFMKSLNSLSVEAQGYLLDAGNGLINMAEGEGVYADTKSIDKNKPLEGTVAVMRNVYFDLALKKPYLIVNYGETSENKINGIDPDAEDLPGGSSYTRVDRLLAFELTSKGESERKKVVKDEVESYNNENMGSGSVFSQMGQAFISLIGAIFLGIPFVLMALFNFILQLLALGLAFVLPFVFILSYIPHFAYSGFVTIGKLLSVFVLKALLGILVCFVYVLCFIVDVLLPPTNFAMYLTNLVVLLVVLLIMIVKRDAIVKLVTAGKVQNFDGNLMNNVKNSVVNPALRGLGAVNPALAAAMNKVGGLRETPTTEAQNTGGSPVRGSFSDVKEERTPQTTENNNETPSNVAKMDERRKEKRNAQSKGKDVKKNGQNPIDKKQTGKQSDKDKETNQLVPVAVSDKERQFDGDNTPENSERKTQAEALLEKKQLENAEERNKQLESVDKADRIPEGQQQLTASVRTKQENQNDVTDMSNYEELRPVQKEERIHKNEGGEKENDVRKTQTEADASRKAVGSSYHDVTNEQLQQTEKTESKLHLVNRGEEQNGVRSIQDETKPYSYDSTNENLKHAEKSEPKMHHTKSTLQDDRSSQVVSGENQKEVTNKKESPLRQQKNESVEKQKREVATEQSVNTSQPQKNSRVSQSQPKANERTKKELEAVEKEEDRNS